MFLALISLGYSITKALDYLYLSNHILSIKLYNLYALSLLLIYTLKTLIS
jgi:hypothetical protein